MRTTILIMGGMVAALVLGWIGVILISGLPWWNIMWGLMVAGAIAAWVLALQDIWRRADLHTSTAIAWTIGVLLFPLVGTLVYYFARPPAGEVRYRGETIS